MAFPGETAMLQEYPPKSSAQRTNGGDLTAFRNMLSTPELYKAQVNTWTRRDVAGHEHEKARHPRVGNGGLGPYAQAG